MLDLHPIRGDEPVIDLLGIPVVPLRAAHGSTNEVLGFRVDSVAYMTDRSYIPADTLGRMDGLVALVLDCVRIAPHDTHFHLEQALETIARLRPEKAYLTHLGHDFDYALWQKRLPKGVALAFDGLKIRAE